MYILTLKRPLGLESYVNEIVFVSERKSETTSKRKAYKRAGVKVVQWLTTRPVKVGELFD